MTAPREPQTEPCPECGTLCTIELHKLHVHYTPVLAVPAGDAGPGLREALRRADDLIGELHAAAFDDADLTDSAHERRYVVERAAIAALAANPTTARDADVARLRLNEIANEAQRGLHGTAQDARRALWEIKALASRIPVATASTGPTGLDRKSEQYLRQSQEAAAEIATWPAWMQRNLTPPTDGGMDL